MRNTEDFSNVINLDFSKENKSGEMGEIEAETISDIQPKIEKKELEGAILEGVEVKISLAEECYIKGGFDSKDGKLTISMIKVPEDLRSLGVGTKLTEELLDFANNEFGEKLRVIEATIMHKGFWGVIGKIFNKDNIKFYNWGDNDMDDELSYEEVEKLDFVL